MSEVSGAIKRIHIPAHAAAVGVARALFADDVVSRPGRAQAARDELLAGRVGLGDQVHAALVLKAHTPLKVRHEKLAGFDSNGRGLGQVRRWLLSHGYSVPPRQQQARWGPVGRWSFGPAGFRLAGTLSAARARRLAVAFLNVHDLRFEDEQIGLALARQP